ncbi:AAA family ATPase, partial [Escherichia coli]|uniref:AAA family ATPase n=1 Tax=Escherichia coli TaxID=562 RepID=UPI0015C48ED7
FGKSNSYKSFLAIDMAGSIATGDIIDGWHGADITDGFPVLYVATEGALGVAKQRIPGWYDAHDIPRDRRNDVVLYPQ